MHQIPIWSESVPLVQAGFGPGAIGRNWASYGDGVLLADNIEDWQRKLLCDPQTSGGLLVACSPLAAMSVLEAFHRAGFAQACAIGHIVQGQGINVT
jgi:selenide,water dikinase